MEKFDEAEESFKEVDVRYSNYEERVFFGHFLIKRNKKELAKEIFEEILNESQYMTKPNRKKNRIWVQEAKDTLNQIL